VTSKKIVSVAWIVNGYGHSLVLQSQKDPTMVLGERRNHPSLRIT